MTPKHLFYKLGTRTVVISGNNSTGGTAVFTDPTRVSERETYPLPVPGQLEACLSAVYTHPPVVFRVEQIRVMHDLEFTNDTRRRMGARYAIDKDGLPYLYSGGNAASKLAQMNSTTYLSRVKYIVRFSMYYKTGVYRNETETDINDRLKHIIQFDRHLKSKTYFRTPYLGTKGCTCDIRAADEADLAETPADINMRYRSSLRGKKTPYGTKDFDFYFVNCVHGVINVPSKEV